MGRIVAGLVTCWLTVAPAGAEAVKVIFDTDIGSDTDDAGALAVLHALADDGKAEILALIHSSRTDTGDNAFGAGALDAINTHYGRGDLALGASRFTDVGDPEVEYVRELARDTGRYGHDVVTAAQVADAVDVYVDTLRRHEDVVILTVGHPIVLHHLLESGHGDLVAERVDRWVAMTGAGHPDWSHDWNFCANGMGKFIGTLLQRWPTDVYLSPHGDTVKTGRILLARYGDDHPVRRAYSLWLAAHDLGDIRQSWDQIATLFAVLGPGNGFRVDGEGGVELDPASQQIRWNPGLDHPAQLRVLPTLRDEELEQLIEELMSRPPRRSDAALMGSEGDPVAGGHFP